MLDQIINITLALATNDIPFRGQREHETKNKNTFLAIIESLSKYNLVLSELL